ncbi:MAG TPA: DHA2 family efflux MFS transporter permease subunit [Rectinemataceae bacterium]|nr:DHA2 family efflux MFS transporter permease subunit [Rectinemataceae bacterium]
MAVFPRDESRVLAATILASSMAFIDGSALNVAMPVIQTSLSASGAELLWVANVYLLVLAAFILVGGSLGDRLGRKRIFLAGIVLFTLASSACGLSPSIRFLIAARTVQGFGGALMIPGSLSIISASVAAERRGRAIGTWSAATTLVTIVGPALGGVLSDLGLWRLVFLINLPLGIAAAFLTTGLSESRDAEATGGIDVAGALLASLSLAALAYGFISAPSFGFADPRIVVSLAVGLLALFLFIAVERQSAAPMLPLSVFASRDFSGANVLTFFLYGALSAVTLFMSLDLVQVHGYSKTQAGLAFLPFAILLTLLSRWAGALADRRGPRLLLGLGPALTGAGFFLISMADPSAGPGNYWRSFLPGILLFGAGMGLTVAPLSSTVMGALPRRLSGTASGVNNAVSRAAGALAIAVLGSVALLVFSHELALAVASSGLDAGARAELLASARDLGATRPPPGLTSGAAESARRAVASSFAGAFRVVMLICSALALASSLAAVLILGRGPDREGGRASPE